MKKILFIITLFSLLFIGCSKEEMFKNSEILEKTHSLKVKTENPVNTETKVHLEGMKVVFDENDELAVFDKTTEKLKYKYNSNGLFEFFERFDDPLGNSSFNQTNNVCYLFPHSQCSGHTGMNIEGYLPETQNYVENSFSQNSHIMYAETDNMESEVTMNNMCGYLKLQLYGTNVKVKNIKLSVTGDKEYVSGDFYCYANEYLRMYGWNDHAGPHYNSKQYVNLNCEENGGVMLGSTPETATIFYIALPPQEYKNGFTITVTDVNDGEFSKSAFSSTGFELERNHIKPMEALEVICVSEQNKIYYTATEKLPLESVKSSSNEDFVLYEHYYDETSQKGVLVYKSIVTTLPSGFLWGYTQLTSITLPYSCTKIESNVLGMCTNLSKIEIKAGKLDTGIGFTTGSDNVTLYYPITLISEGFTQNYLNRLPTVTTKPANNEIWYIADAKIGYNDGWGEGVSIVSHYYNEYSKMGVIRFNNNVTALTERNFFRQCINKIYLPQSLITIGDSVFEECTSLSYIDMSAVQTIGSHCIKNCDEGLTEIKFPETLTHLGREAVSWNDNLVTVEFTSAEPPTLETGEGYGVFHHNESKLENVYVPAEHINKYRNYQQNGTNGWGQIRYDIIKLRE